MKQLQAIHNALDSINAKDTVIYDMQKTSPFYDYFIITSVTSKRQLQAASTNMKDELAKIDHHTLNIEGKNSDAWVLIDTGSCIVNIFTKEEREYYDLEKMLAQIERVTIDDLQ